MCGIAGFISNEASEHELSQMVSTLHHRGPNHQDHYYKAEHGLGLGHARLQILDLNPRSNQPFHSACGRYTMVYNGEVYNYRELKKSLSCDWSTESDTEVVIQAFVEWGLDAVNRFNGMFAIGLWDHQTSELHLIRDRMGIKPLFYYYDGKNIAFSSETKALLQLPFYQLNWNRNAINDYLFLEYIPGDQSAFEGVKKVGKGEMLTFSQQKISTRKYYDLLSHATFDSAKNESEHLAEFEDLFTSSLKYRSISDVPVGTFLSGGTDSSLISKYAQMLNGDSISSYTVKFDVPAFDESEYATQVANHFKLPHTILPASASECLDIAQRLVKSYDEPFAAPSGIPSMLVTKKAAQEVTVALSGDGGDELFMGYGYYQWYDRIQKVNKLGGAIGRKALAKGLSLMDNRKKRAARVFDFDGPMNWMHIWSQEQYMFNEQEVSRLSGETYKHQTLLASWNRIDAMNITPHEKISLFDLQHYLPQNLLYKMDIASMASSLEVRVPFLDHRLVEFALRTPQHLKIQQGKSKYLLKKALEKHLPPNLVHRPKWGFPAPVHDWMKADLKPMLGEFLSKDALIKSDLVDPDAALKILKDYQSGQDYDYKRVWALIVLQMWHATYFDNQT